MKSRLPVIVVILAMVLVACGGGSTPDTTTPEPDTTTPAETVLLSYSLVAGRSMTFEVDIDQTLEMNTTGNAAAMGEEDFPGAMTLHTVGTGSFTFSVKDGSDTGTYEVTLTGDFSDLTITGTLDGEPVDADEIPDLAELGPIDVTFVVDEQGNIITDAPDLDGLLGGLLGGLEDLGDAAVLEFPFFGPPFSEEEVSVGDSWTKTIDVPGMGDEVYTTEIRSTVARTEVLDGVEAMVIDSVTNTPRIELDMAAMIIGMMEALLQFGEPTEEDIAEFTAIMEQIRFLIVVPASRTDSTVWFDNEAGVTRKAEFDGNGGMTFDVAMPDELTGEIMEFGMTVTASQKITYRLVSSTDS